MNILEEYGIKEDPRFIRAKKEAWIILVGFVIMTIATFIAAYIGTQIPPEEYTFVMGIPAWYFYAGLFCLILWPIVSLYIGFVVVQDCELGDTKK